MFLELIYKLVYSQAMIKLNIHEVKVRLSECIEMVEAGETIVVCKRNIPVAELRQITTTERRKPVLGSAAGTGKISKTFQTMPGPELRLWEEGDKNDPLKKYAARSGKRRK